MRRRRHQILFIFFIVSLLFIAGQALYILSPFFQPIFWAFILVFAFYPLHEKLRRRLKIHETWAAGITTLVIFLAFLPLVIFVALNLAAETAKFYQWTLSGLQDGTFAGCLERIQSLAAVQKMERALLKWNLVKEHYQGWLLNGAAAVGNYAAVQAAALTRNLLLFPMYFFLTFFVVFFFLRDGHKMVRFLYTITPLEEENKKDIFRQINDTLTAVIRGQILTSLVQATLAGVIFWTLGLPLPIFFAALTFLATMIPVLGAPLVWFPLVLYLASQQQFGKAALLFFLGVFGISLIDNFLKPLLIGEKTRLPYVLLFLGILGGIQVYGLVGLFLAPTVFSIFFSLVRIYREKFL